MVSKENVFTTLEPYHPMIRQVVDRAWDEWQTMERYRRRKHLAPVLYPRTIANHVFDAMARTALDIFANVKGVNIKNEPQTIKLFFNGKVCGRFKKGDDDGLGRNFPTQAALAFTDQDALLPGFPPVAKVEFVWAANLLGTSLDTVSVVARDGDHILWSYEITKRPPAVILPFKSGPSAKPQGTPLITAKPDKVKKPTSDTE